jgi:mannose-6-phosphate isomerase
VKPIALPPNVLRHFYAGGARIGELRGLRLDRERSGDEREARGTCDHMPEEWIGAVNATFGSEERGLSRLADGSLLRDRIAAEPEAFLGPDHVARFGAGPALLVKLLDAGERLPVHFHPGRDFARGALASPYGKTEAWLIVHAEPGASVHVGFAAPVEEALVREWVRVQDAGAMLAAMHELPVRAGDAFLVPAGTPHAIGEGILLVELQEPTDFSVLLEWRRFGVNSGAEHLGLGWDTALAAVDRTPADPRTFTSDDALLPPAADPYFRAERPTANTELEPSFAVLMAVEGEGTLRTQHGDELVLKAGTSVLVPHAAGATTLAGELDAIRCLPPDPRAGRGDW